MKIAQTLARFFRPLRVPVLRQKFAGIVLRRALAGRRVFLMQRFPRLGFEEIGVDHDLRVGGERDDLAKQDNAVPRTERAPREMRRLAKIGRGGGGAGGPAKAPPSPVRDEGAAAGRSPAV